MTINSILAVELLVEDYGWDAVMDMLMAEAATAPDERLEEVEELLDAAIAVNEGKGQLFVLWHLVGSFREARVRTAFQHEWYLNYVE